tara:strand:+ start:2199 stop:2600 length:402 start_codon:yes stop_codon:yes gene_type:complete
MLNSYKIDFVVCNNKREFNKYSRTYGGKDSVTIDYITITNKLIKSNFHESTPHPVVIGVAIKSAFTNVFNKTQYERIIYMVKDLDYELVGNFKSMILDVIGDEIDIEYGLIYINTEENEKVHCEFNNINNLEF